jgi:histone deacetylase complex regulatory component SIN3
MSEVSQSQVFAQVQVLFKDAPDLLAEFKDFLPSASGEPGRFVGKSFTSLCVAHC